MVYYSVAFSKSVRHIMNVFAEKSWPWKALGHAQERKARSSTPQGGQCPLLLQEISISAKVAR